ncbi:hypothetical protein VB773_02150 [Haloarculaceae archaeon H-GB2-1]|nr:hypothetical protein [Haloarculaceae archaeon H-GB11]MEA5406498.1 hypothetical protein [Haloarculaceae archaeon H-GB2-1]
MTDEGPRRVAFYLPSFERGGVERFVINVTRPMVADGFAVDLLTVRCSGTVDQLPDGVRHLDVGSPLLLEIADRVFPSHVAAGIASLPGYVEYLRSNRPMMVLSSRSIHSLSPALAWPTQTRLWSFERAIPRLSRLPPLRI